jgi:dephospho-CoA kinase
VISIGLTGGIAAGKSEVARLLAKRGARAVDADAEAHRTYAIGQPGHGQIVTVFGRGVLGANGEIDRAKLGAAVFGSQEQLDRLSAIVWPLTRARIEEMKRQAASDGVRVFVVEAALLIEAGWQDMFDEVWFVKASPEVAAKRLSSRGLSEADARPRLASRPGLPDAERAATRVIENNGSLDGLEAQVEDLWRVIQSRA